MKFLCSCIKHLILNYFRTDLHRLFVIDIVNYQMLYIIVMLVCLSDLISLIFNDFAIDGSSISETNFDEIRSIR